jgi:hypothetical protein
MWSGIIGYQIVFRFAIPLEKARCSLSELDNPCEPTSRLNFRKDCFAKRRVTHTHTHTRGQRCQSFFSNCDKKWVVALQRISRLATICTVGLE